MAVRVHGADARAAASRRDSRNTTGSLGQNKSRRKSPLRSGRFLARARDFPQPAGRRGGVADMRRTDVLIAAVTQRRGVVGAKPPAWTQWVLDLLGYQSDEDKVDDLFPGSGDVSAAIADYRPGCGWCTRPMSGRRDRHFCSDRCRVAAHRARKRVG